jgi:energy-converting hydrogenase Eha subunit H
MLLSADVMRLLLFLCLLGMAIVAALFLRSRSISLTAYLMWGLLIILVPLFGPFVVILAHPGESHC